MTVGLIQCRFLVLSPVAALNRGRAPRKLSAAPLNEFSRLSTARHSPSLRLSRSRVGLRLFETPRGIFLSLTPLEAAEGKGRVILNMAANSNSSCLP